MFIGALILLAVVVVYLYLRSKSTSSTTAAGSTATTAGPTSSQEDALLQELSQLESQIQAQNANMASGGGSTGGGGGLLPFPYPGGASGGGNGGGSTGGSTPPSSPPSSPPSGPSAPSSGSSAPAPNTPAPTVILSGTPSTAAISAAHDYVGPSTKFSASAPPPPLTTKGYTAPLGSALLSGQAPPSKATNHSGSAKGALQPPTHPTPPHEVLPAKGVKAV